MAESSWVARAQRLITTSRIIAKRGGLALLQRQPPSAKLLRELCEDLGTTYIKIGQFIASAPSLFPKEYVEEFQSCLDQTSPLPFSALEPTLQKAFQVPLSSVFSFIDEQPLASASIAQVHAAQLKNGERVVLKIQKPHVKTIIQTDLSVLHFFTSVVERWVPNLDMMSLADMVNEIRRGMINECDFRLEANNSKAFQVFLDKRGITNVITPKIYDALSSEKVLVMEHVDGIAFTNLEKLSEYTASPQLSLLNAMNAWYGGLIEGEPFHADVHAGNLLLMRDGRVAFIDFGLVGQVKKSTWSGTTKLIQALTQADYRSTAEALIAIGMTKNNINVDIFAADIAKLFTFESNIKDSYLASDPNQQLMALVETAKKHGLHFPHEFALLIKQILYFDRYSHILADADYISMDEAESFLPDLFMSSTDEDKIGLLPRSVSEQKQNLPSKKHKTLQLK
ncbi:MAG: AarF/UbiB family protein [Pseudomonadota bacterium]